MLTLTTADTDTISSTAAQHDLVINATTGYHPASASAAITGLAQRKAATGRPTYYIHTSGVSGLADTPFTHKYTFDDPTREFNDADGENIYQYEKQRDAQTPYLQRTTDIMVFEKGLELGVQTLIIMSPLIYGIGTGLYNRVSIQIPAYIKSAMKHGQSVMVGDGKGEWDYVHVVDLAELYELAALDMLRNGGEKLPKGEKGVTLWWWVVDVVHVGVAMQRVMPHRWLCCVACCCVPNHYSNTTVTVRSQ